MSSFLSKLHAPLFLILIVGMSCSPSARYRCVESDSSDRAELFSCYEIIDSEVGTYATSPAFQKIVVKNRCLSIDTSHSKVLMLADDHLDVFGVVSAEYGDYLVRFCEDGSYEVMADLFELHGAEVQRIELSRLPVGRGFDFTLSYGCFGEHCSQKTLGVRIRNADVYETCPSL